MPLPAAPWHTNTEMHRLQETEPKTGKNPTHVAQTNKNKVSKRQKNFFRFFSVIT